jgi:hypothetical protein
MINWYRKAHASKDKTDMKLLNPYEDVTVN